MTQPSPLQSQSTAPNQEVVFHRWLSGIPYEVAFWESYYGNPRRLADLNRWSQYGKECSLEGFDIGEYISSCPDMNPRLLDVGAALSYAFGNIICGKEADVTYVDPLALFYNDILHRTKADRPEISFGMIEYLSLMYGRDKVNFIHVRNALDHSSNPVAGLLQCLLTVKEGGIVYLNHFTNEAERENYRGFHQYNIACKEGHLHFWNQSGDVDVTALCEGFADVDVSVTDGGRVVAVIRKKAPVPAAYADSEATSREMGQRIMYMVAYFHRFRNSMRYQLSRLTSTVGHRVMRLLPYSLLNRVKRMAAKK